MSSTLYKKINVHTPTTKSVAATPYKLPKLRVANDSFDLAIWRFLSSNGDPSSNLVETPLAITNATNATPIVITTSTNHGLVTNGSENGGLAYTSKVWIQGVHGNGAANGVWTITKLTDTTFSLDTSIGNGAYISGGTVSKQYVKSNFTPITYTGTDVMGLDNPVALFPGTWPNYFEGPPAVVSPLVATNGGLTVSFWVYKTEYLATYEDLVRKRRAPSTSTNDTAISFYMNNTGDGRWVVQLETTSTAYSKVVSGDFIIPLNQWTHVACTYDGIRARIYKNGVLYSNEQVQPGTTELNYQGGQWVFAANTTGVIDSNFRRPFKGKLEDIRVANILRSESYLKSIYTSIF